MRHHENLTRLIQAMIQHRLGTQTIDSLHLDMEPMDALLHEISQLTRRPQNDFVRGEKTSSSVVQRTRYCTPEEWNDNVREASEWRARLQEDMDRAQNELRRMTAPLDQGFQQSASELPSP